MAKSKWDKLVEKFFFLYKDGLFELPYLSNSAQIMVNSVIELKVAKNKPLERAVYSNNPFFKGTHVLSGTRKKPLCISQPPVH